MVGTMPQRRHAVLEEPFPRLRVARLADDAEDVEEVAGLDDLLANPVDGELGERQVAERDDAEKGFHFNRDG